jgi:phage host-nuclease inhibitor protein Gam
MSKSLKDEMVLMLQRKNKEQEEAIKMLHKQIDEQRKGETGAEAKIKAINEMHSQKTKALLKSINLLKKEIQKTKYE